MAGLSFAPGLPGPDTHRNAARPYLHRGVDVRDGRRMPSVIRRGRHAPRTGSTRAMSRSDSRRSPRPTTGRSPVQQLARHEAHALQRLLSRRCPTPATGTKSSGCGWPDFISAVTAKATGPSCAAAVEAEFADGYLVTRLCPIASSSPTADEQNLWRFWLAPEQRHSL